MQKVKIKEENEGGQQTVATVGGNRQEKKKTVIEKIQTFFERYFGL